MAVAAKADRTYVAVAVVVEEESRGGRANRTCVAEARLIETRLPQCGPSM